MKKKSYFFSRDAILLATYMFAESQETQKKTKKHSQTKQTDHLFVLDSSVLTCIILSNFSTWVTSRNGCYAYQYNTLLRNHANLICIRCTYLFGASSSSLFIDRSYHMIISYLEHHMYIHFKYGCIQNKWNELGIQ